jgi:AcrR family transcriptional regulator
MNRRHMTDDHHGQMAGRATLLVRAVDEILGTHRGEIAEQILTAARTSFATRGYAGTTLRDVAAAANVDRALVTYYFTSKAGLLAAAIEPPAGLSRTPYAPAQPPSATADVP